MRVKELQVVISGNIDEENGKQLLLQAVKNNFSLRSVQGDRDGGSIFNNDDKARLVFTPVKTNFWTNGSTMLRRLTEKFGLRP